MSCNPLELFPLRTQSPVMLSKDARSPVKPIKHTRTKKNHWLSIVSSDPNFGVKNHDDLANFRRYYRRIACSNLMSVTDPEFCLNVIKSSADSASNDAMFNHSDDNVKQLARTAKQESEILQIECNWLSMTLNMDTCPRVPNLMTILSSKQSLLLRLKRASEVLIKVSEYVYHKEREVRYANCPVNSLPRAAGLANSLTNDREISLLSKGATLNSSRIRASPLCVKTFSSISAKQTRLLVIAREETMLMSLEDRLSRASDAYYDAKLAYDDNNLYALLAVRYGPLSESVYEKAKYPGKVYQAKLNRSAHIIQRFWHSCWPYLVIVRGCAILRIQTCFRRYYYHKKYHPLIKLRLKVGRTSYFKRSIAAWKKYVKLCRISKMFVRSDSHNLLHSVIVEWKKEVMSIKAQRTFIARKFLSRLMNPQMTKCFVGWQTFTITSRQIKKMFKRSLLKPSMDAWKHHHMNIKRLKIAMKCSIIIQSFYRGHLARKVVKQRLNMVCNCQKVVRGYLLRRNLGKIRLMKEKQIYDRFVNFNSHVSLTDLAEKERARLVKKRKAINLFESTIISQLRDHLSKYCGKVQIAFEVSLLKDKDGSRGSSSSLTINNALNYVKSKLFSASSPDQDEPKPAFLKPTNGVDDRVRVVKKKDQLSITKFAETSISDYRNEEKSKTEIGFSAFGNQLVEPASIMISPSNDIGISAISVTPHEAIAVNRLVERASLIARDIGSHDFESKYPSRFCCPAAHCESILLTCDQLKSHINMAHSNGQLITLTEPIMSICHEQELKVIQEHIIRRKSKSHHLLANFSDFYVLLEEPRVLAAMNVFFEGVMPDSRIYNTLQLWIGLSQLEKVPYFSSSNDQQLIDYSKMATDIYDTYLCTGSNLTHVGSNTIKQIENFMTIFRHREFDGFFRFETVDAQKLGVTRRRLLNLSKFERLEFWTDENIVPTDLFEDLKWECIIIIWRLCRGLVESFDETAIVVNDINDAKSKKNKLLVSRCLDHSSAECKSHAKDTHQKLKQVASLADRVVAEVTDKLIDQMLTTLSSKAVYEALIDQIQSIDAILESSLVAADDIVDWALDSCIDEIFDKTIMQASKDKFVRLMITGKVERTGNKKVLAAVKIQSTYRGFWSRKGTRLKVSSRFRKRFERAINKMVYIDTVTGKEYLRRPAIIGIIFPKSTF